jgi:hypothetical protein
MNGMNDGAPPKPRRRWIWVVLGVIFVLFCLFVGGILFTVSYFRENMQIAENISDDSAKNEFDAVHARFPGQRPLLELRDGRPQLVPERTAQSRSGQSLTTLHVIAFDKDDEDLVKFSVPFWLLRMKSGPIKLSNYSDGWDDRGVSFEIKDIEAAGPGIVVDVDSAGFEQRGRGGQGRMLIWVE